MLRTAAAGLLCVALGGCTQVVDDARARAVVPVAPITAGQVGGLLSDKTAPEHESNLFVTAEPEKCAGLAQEVDPPFIFARTPAAHDGGQFYGDAARTVSVQQMAAVYRADFDTAAAVDTVRRAIDSCRDDALAVTTMEGKTIDFRLLPPRDSGSPQIVLWSITGGWSCDNAFVAAHNAAIELTACAQKNGFDVLSVAREALQRINTLADMTV
ncbi:sensor domain-containing protein [Mycobacterium sp. NPDC050041]|uniref:sensor domain-containing protein n=1 Tax=Mycobacterium sp. NPDC050041 TaxID=3364293 RepID=UPI003C2F658C